MSRENGVNDVTIKIMYCGMCQTDVHFAKNDWENTTYPIVPGYCVHIPEKLPLERAAPLLGAGITVYGKRTIKGSIIGSVEEIEEMMEFCGKYEVLPDIEIVPINKINEAFDRLAKNDVKFRFVLDIES
nr:probable cinnamyl alcohol dehydrogenase 6 [Ipomoea batatas]